MDIDQLIDLEIQVREEVDQLRKQIAEAELAPPGKLDGTEGRLSRQDSLMRHEIDKEAHRRRQQRLLRLEEALKKMDAGTFGVCVNCQGEMEFARLSSQPESSVCQACASQRQ